jgi:hypothetical protein
VEKQYIIAESELLSLLDSQRELSALQAAGVDNWDCGDISELFDREIDAEDLEEMYQLYVTILSNNKRQRCHGSKVFKS